MRGEFDRRQFLFGAGAVASMGLGATTGLLGPAMARAQATTSTAQVRTRRNVTSSAAAADLDALRRGVAAMKKLIDTDPKDPRGWILQAYIHGNCTSFTHCQHGSWFFAPWHRVFIYYFEQLIGSLSNTPGFSLPYWDWSTAHSVPASFYGSGNALDDTVSIRNSCSSAPTAGRGRSQSDAFSANDLKTYVGSAVVGRIQANPDFVSYAGAQSGAGELERTPHNFVHRWVGGAKNSNMVQTFSPLDPIFWMHHCNIDRLYSDWLARPGHRPPPADSPWAKRSFNDFVNADGKPAGGEWTCGQTTDSRVLGYVYDTLKALPPGLREASVRESAPSVVASLTGDRAELGDGLVSFATTSVAEADQRMQFNAAAVAPHRYGLRLRIRGLKTPSEQNTAVQVFLGDKIDRGANVDSPGYVGSITFFDGHAEGESAHAGHGGGEVILNATHAYRALYGLGGAPEQGGLKVSLLTRPLYEGIEKAAEVSEVQPDQIVIEVVDLGDID